MTILQPRISVASVMAGAAEHAKTLTRRCRIVKAAIAVITAPIRRCAATLTPATSRQKKCAVAVMAVINAETSTKVLLTPTARIACTIPRPPMVSAGAARKTTPISTLMRCAVRAAVATSALIKPVTRQILAATRVPIARRTQSSAAWLTQRNLWPPRCAVRVLTSSCQARIRDYQTSSCPSAGRLRVATIRNSASTALTKSSRRWRDTSPMVKHQAMRSGLT